ncbi:hypothetical protein SVIOM342S_05941 [Streptomyces violaceorubidus]
MADWGLRSASAADVEAVAELRAMVLRADLERLGRYDGQRVRQRVVSVSMVDSRNRPTVISTPPATGKTL